MPEQAERDHPIMRFVTRFAIALVLISLLPAIVGLSSGRPYLGVQTNTDDHMVYASWMHQAAEGRFLFENRFTTDAQPGLTFHLYFLVLGWISKFLGFALTSTLSRAGFSLLFFWLLGKIFVRSEVSIYASKLAIALIGAGGGLGFLVWHTFGQAIVKPSPLAGPMLSRLPTDVWQTEGFVFPSMLGNGLFMASLCLILGVFGVVLSARTSKKAVWVGALCLGVLMNIHSYDVLLLTLVLLGFLVTTIRSGSFTSQWCGRTLLMGVGALPAAAWFVHVLRNDPVFQYRAATPTYSPNFRQYLFGYLPGLVLGLVGLWRTNRVGVLAFAGVLVAGFFAAASHLQDGYWLGPAAFVGLALAGLAICWFLAGDCQLTNLFAAWMVMGLVAPYFPGLFQRKLAMGLAIPIAALAAIGIARLIESRNRSSRNMATILGCLVMGGSSLLWLARDFQLQGENVSNTTVHPVFLGTDEAAIVRYLEGVKGRKVVVAVPGIPLPAETPDAFASPVIADLNPILVGLTGATAIAGHWSETPQYMDRRNDITKAIYLQPDANARQAALEKLGVNFLVIPDAAAFAEFPFRTAVTDGELVYDGVKFDLLRIRP